MAEARDKLGYVPALDGLRAIAVAMVIGYHYWRIPLGGYLGVDLFFVLSGFLITTLLVEEHAIYGTVSLRLFYARRALRLFPALVFLVLVSGVLYDLVNHQREIVGAIEALTYTINIGVAVNHYGNGYDHLWSLGVEEQFYLAWPILLTLALRRHVKPLRLAGILFAAAFAIAATRYGLTPAHVGRRWGASTVTRFDSILLGCAAAMLRQAGVRVTAARGLSLVAVPVACLVVVVATGQDSVYRGYTFAFSLVAAVVILGVAAGRIWFVPLAWSPLVYVGRLSYALYLWHVICLALISARLPALALTVAFAIVSYHLVERPFLRAKWRLARTTSHDRGGSLGHHPHIITVARSPAEQVTVP